MEQAETVEVIAQAINMDEFKLVPLAKIVSWKEPRDFSDKDIMRMALSLQTNGQVHALTVEPLDAEADTFIGVTGRLRFEGARYANIPELLCRVKRFKCESERLSYQLAENITRKSFTVIEKAERFRKLYEAMKKELGGVKDKSIVFGIAQSIQEVSGEEGPSENAVYKYLKVSKLPDQVKTKIGTSSKFGLRHALELSRLKDKPEVQLDVAEKFLQKPTTTQKFKQQVDVALGIKAESPKPTVTNATVECPICHVHYVLVHQDKGKHSLRRVKQDRLAQALSKTRDALTTKRFNLTSWIDTMQHFGATSVEAIEQQFWKEVEAGHIVSCGAGFFRFREVS